MKEKLKKITDNKFFRKLFSDFMLSAVALVIYNGVVQFLVYPRFERKLGGESYGDVLYYISILSIMASTFGTAANFSRMVQSTKKHDRNGDYNFFLTVSAVLCVPVVTAFAVIYRLPLPVSLGFLIAMVLYILRFYADCEFKLNINYRGFLVYYVLASAGYGLGTLFFEFTSFSAGWTIPIILGEACAVLYVVFRGSIFRKPAAGKSEFRKETLASCRMLCGANIIPAVILNADRLLLKPMYGGDATTQFYIASLVGKTVSFVTLPLNGVMIGYLSKWKGNFTRKIWLLSSAALFGAGVLATAACTVGSYLYTMLIYRDYLETIKQYFIIASAGQVFYFMSNSLMVIVLRFAEEKYQTVINAVYAVLFVLVVPFSTYRGGITGFAVSLLAVNFIKYFIVVAAGLIKIGKSGAAVTLAED